MPQVIIVLVDILSSQKRGVLPPDKNPLDFDYVGRLIENYGWDFLDQHQPAREQHEALKRAAVQWAKSKHWSEAMKTTNEVRMLVGCHQHAWVQYQYNSATVWCECY
jgi:hypothetical protein